MIDAHEKPRSKGTEILYGKWDGQLTFEFIVIDTSQRLVHLHTMFDSSNQLSEKGSIYTITVTKVKLNLLLHHCDETPASFLCKER